MIEKNFKVAKAFINHLNIIKNNTEIIDNLKLQELKQRYYIALFNEINQLNCFDNLSNELLNNMVNLLDKKSCRPSELIENLTILRDCCIKGYKPRYKK